MQSLLQRESIAQPLPREEAIEYSAFTGKGTGELIGMLSAMRIKHFWDYPHLYHGNADNDYERQCAEELCRSDHTIFVTAHCGKVLAGIAAAFPLVSAAEILDGKETTFSQSHYRPSDFYYFSEIVVAPDFRGYGIGGRLYNETESQAVTWGYPAMCLATIARDNSDPRRPRGYRKPPYLWSQLGFTLTDIRFAYSWPTLMADGSTSWVPNKMALWIKTKLRKRPQL